MKYSTKNQMNSLSEFKAFAKGKINQIEESQNCVVYTRVSSKEQFDSNNSIDTQIKLCQQFAINNNLKIIENFGATYESAQSDQNRKEFNRMMEFIKSNSKLKIKKILVYNLDRFSRTGTSAIAIAEKLYKEHKIRVVSVSDPMDTESVYGQYIQSLKFLNSNLDNNLRRMRCVDGMKHAMLRGEWPHGVPFGYTSVRTNGKRQVIINKKGQILKNAFIWKGEEKLGIEEIRIKLRGLGLEIRHQKLSKILRNPFYCGILSHSILEGEVVEGKHEPLISRELFKLVNEELFKNTHGYSIKKENINIPLKTYLRCEYCGSHMPGYIVKKKNIWYYKCRTKGCCNNINAGYIHDEFRRMISSYQINLSENLLIKLKYDILNKFSSHIENLKKRQSYLKANQTEVEKEIESLIDMFVKNQIDQETFENTKNRYKAKLDLIQSQIKIPVIELSNLENLIENTLKFSSNLVNMWDKGNYQVKREIQKFIFPQGIIYNKKNNTCRTPEINLLINYICCESKDTDDKKKSETMLNDNFALLVELQGIEPWSGVGNDGAFYMFIGNCCREREGLSNTDPVPYAAL